MRPGRCRALPFIALGRAAHRRGLSFARTSVRLFRLGRLPSRRGEVADELDGLIDREQARTHPRRNVITRAVGMERRVPCDTFRIDLRPGDTLLLCSDGLSNMVTDREMAGVLAHEAELKDAGEKLLSMALERGAPDNVTVLLARI